MSTGNQIIADVKDIAREGVGDQGRCPLCERAGAHFLLKAPDRFNRRREMYAVLRCDSCGGAWLNAPPKPEEMDHHYGEYYHLAIATAGNTKTERRWGACRRVVKRHKDGGAILDVGCSAGGFLSVMRGRDWKLHGIEIAPATAEKARAATGGEIFAGDVLQAPFRAGSFDVITCFDVLEHVYEPRKVIAKIWEWLKPGGIFVVRVPNIDSWEARLFGSYWFALELPRHLFHFSPGSLRNVMKEKDFEEVSVITLLGSYVEPSIAYIRGSLLESLGFHRAPIRKADKLGILRRVVRKVFRLSIVVPFCYLAARSFAGGQIEAVFAKPFVLASGVDEQPARSAKIGHSTSDLL